MENVKLSIPDMQSAHCQSRVGAAIKDIDGLKVEKFTTGELVATVDSDEVKEELIAAIEKAGYKVGNDHNKTSTTLGGCCSR